MAKVARAASFFPLAFAILLLLCHTSVGGGLVSTGTRTVCAARLGMIGGFVAFLGFILSDLQLVYLLVQLGNRVRYPFRSPRRVVHFVIVPPLDLSLSRYSACTFMVLLNDIGNELRVLIAKYRPSVYSLIWFASDGRSCLDTPGGPEGSAEVSLFAIDLYASALVL